MSDKNGFRLQPVLNVKSSLVDALEVEFARLKALHQDEMDILLALQQAEGREMEALRRQQQKDLLNCEEICHHQQYLASLAEYKAQQAERVKEAKLRMETKREELVTTMQDQKVLEKLREHHQAGQTRDRQRREARTVDELVTARYRHGR
jgi:flagellar export protein FliJ